MKKVDKCEDESKVLISLEKYNEMKKVIDEITKDKIYTKYNNYSCMNNSWGPPSYYSSETVNFVFYTKDELIKSYSNQIKALEDTIREMDKSIRLYKNEELIEFKENLKKMSIWEFLKLKKK